MIYPKVSEIMQHGISTVHYEQSLGEAVKKLLESSHDLVVVTTAGIYYMLNVYELIKLYRVYGESLALKDIDLKPLCTVYEEENVKDIVHLLRKGVETFAVVNKNGAFSGIVLQADLIASIDPETLRGNYRIVDLFKIKKRNRWISKHTPFIEAVSEMEKREYDAYLIVEARRCIGVLTSRDILRHVERGVDMTKDVETYMSTPVQTVPAEATLQQAFEFMERTSFKRIITTDNDGFLVGSLTKKELMSISFATWMSTLMRYQQELQNLNEELEQKTRKYEIIASYDPLTGLYNRRKFIELFSLEYSVMVERDNMMTIMLIDIDHFKEINDTYGHNVGDLVLKEVAAILRKAFRDVDVVARWGGDEFVALLPAADCKTAYQIAEERIRREVETLSFIDMPVSVSVGVSDVHIGDDVQSALGRADEVLYRAKREGRNRVLFTCAEAF